MDPVVHTRRKGSRNSGVQPLNLLRTRRRLSAYRPHQSVGKVRTTVSWNLGGVIYIGYLEKNKTITGLYIQCRIIGSIRRRISGNMSHLEKKKVLFHYDNRLTHPLPPRKKIVILHSGYKCLR